MNNRISLTNREQEVLELIVDGQSNVEISKKLSISISTVKAYCKSIFFKLKVNNRVRAVVKAISIGLVWI